MSAHQMRGTRPSPPVLLAAAHDPEQAAQAIAEGADLLDVSGAGRRRAAIRAAFPGAVWETGSADVLDADQVAAEAASEHDPSAAAVVAAAALATWLDAAPAIRARDIRSARRAIDMAAVIAGRRPPARTVRGLG